MIRGRCCIIQQAVENRAEIDAAAAAKVFKR